MGRKKCDNPLKRKHSTKSATTDVRPISEDLLRKVREFFPEVEWNSYDRLCSSCRWYLSETIPARENARDMMNRIRTVFSQQSITENESGSEDPVDEIRPEGSNSQLGSFPHTATPLSLPYSQQESFNPSAPPLSLPNTQSTGSGLDVLTQPSQNSFLLEPSVIRYNFEALLSNLGIRVESSKPKGKEILILYKRCMQVIQERFAAYVGKIPDEDEINCESCLKLIQAIQNKFPLVVSKKEKYFMLTSLPTKIKTDEIRANFDVSLYLARKAAKLRREEGPFSAPVWRKTGKAPNPEVDAIVVNWYLSDDNSRESPNARDTILVKINGNTTRQPKRYMLTNRLDGYNEFKRDHPGLVKMTKFASLRPVNCRWPGHKGVHESCTCPIHANFKLLLEGLKFASIDQIRDENDGNSEKSPYEGILGDYKEFFKHVLCLNTTDLCYLGFCSQCPDEGKLERIYNFTLGLDIKYCVWENNDVVTKTDSNEDFIQNFNAQLQKVLSHELVYKRQKDFIRDLKAGDLDGGKSAVLTVDFGENYSFVIQDAVQGFHWNNIQATICPFVLNYKQEGFPETRYKTYFVISDEMSHDASTVHAFKGIVINKIKLDFPQITNIHYVSDGAASQFKNYKNLGNLAFHEEEFGLQASWIFTATGHGKSTCDGMSAVVKRAMRLRSLNAGELINTALRMFEVANTSLTSVTLEFFLVSQESVRLCRESLVERYGLLQRIPGIRQNHHFEVQEPKAIILMRRYSSSDLSTTTCILASHVEHPQTPENADSGTIDLGDFLAIAVRHTYQIGMVTKIHSEIESYSVRTMTRRGKGGAALVWPPQIKEYDVFTAEIITKISPPEYSTSFKNYRLNKPDLERIKRIMN